MTVIIFSVAIGLAIAAYNLAELVSYVAARKYKGSRR